MEGNRWFNSLFLLVLTMVFVFHRGITTCHARPAAAPARNRGGGGFVQTRGANFFMNGKPFYLNGFNAYWMMIFAADPSTKSKVTDAFQEASKYGMNIARTWAFNEGDYKPLQSSPGTYDEEIFKVKKNIINSFFLGNSFFFSLFPMHWSGIALITRKS